LKAQNSFTKISQSHAQFDEESSKAQNGLAVMSHIDPGFEEES
jgi:hypothetical protein